ncbi:GNAT family N-acetyltransferase [Nioella sp. MMSF_3534]|uniref:GNAT family N-acetyltransferase n=1 Tax=Nioella sp. MMSF_3534 TaxID=3046720 RepID=UPI00273FAF57|nr:GNAT family N-acetyltransferase [Nioella sp. MMSF_3534]
MILRAFVPSDRDWLIDRHRVLYGAEFGFTPDFGNSIAEKLDAFLAREDPAKHLWIAEADGQRIGSIAISDRNGTGFLNFVLLEPSARGQGLGHHLMQTALDHARSKGFTQATLETYSCLTAARALYRAHGFTISETDPGWHRFGQSFDREFWQADL